MVDFVVSMHYSGTHTTFETLAGPKYVLRKIPHFCDALGAELTHCHSETRNMKSIYGWYREIRKLVLTMRDPRDTALTWFVRHRRRGFHEEWENLASLAELDCHVFYVDRPDYEALSEYVGHPVQVVTPKGSMGRYMEKRLNTDERRQLVGRNFKFAEHLVETHPLARIYKC